MSPEQEMKSRYNNSPLEKLILSEVEGGKKGGCFIKTALLRRELHQMYGFDPGGNLATLFGIEVLSIDSKKLSLEE